MQTPHNPFTRKFEDLISRYPGVFNENKFPAIRRKESFFFAFILIVSVFSCGVVPVSLTQIFSELPAVYYPLSGFVTIFAFFFAWIAAIDWEAKQFDKIDAELTDSDRHWIASALRDFHKNDIWGGEQAVEDNPLIKSKLKTLLNEKALGLLSDNRHSRVNVLRYVFLNTSATAHVIQAYHCKDSFMACYLFCMRELEETKQKEKERNQLTDLDPVEVSV